MKAAGYNFGRLRIGTVGATFNLASGTIGSTDAGIVSSIQSFGNGWYRCVISKAASTANEVIRINVNEALTGDYAGNGTSGIYVFGAQYETGSIATSYIPTTAAPVTRNADEVTLSGPVSGCIGQTEGTLYIECENVSAANDVFYLNRDSNNSVVIRKDASNIFTGQIRASGSVTPFVGASGVTGIVKIAIAYKSGDSAMYLNGLQVGTTRSDAITFSAALGKVTLSDTGFFTGKSPTRIRAAALYTTRLTNAELAALTTL
jgi:hypothetical protein